jgi:hypothetical protein
MKLAIRLLALVLITGCAASAPKADAGVPAPPSPAEATADTSAPAPETTSSAYSNTIEHIWAALPKAYKAVGITVNAVDTATHSMGFSGRIRRQLGGTALSKYFKCGSGIGDNADTYDLHLFVGTQVGRDPRTDGIIVTTSLQISARSAFGGTRTKCTSNGELEAKLRAALRAELQR